MCDSFLLKRELNTVVNFSEFYLQCNHALFSKVHKLASNSTHLPRQISEGKWGSINCVSTQNMRGKSFTPLKKFKCLNAQMLLGTGQELVLCWLASSRLLQTLRSVPTPHLLTQVLSWSRPVRALSIWFSWIHSLLQIRQEAEPYKEGECLACPKGSSSNRIRGKFDGFD